MKMDGNSSDNSRTVSENTNSSWNWDNEDVSVSRIHLGPPMDDLQDIVEDKEIAACAVAFVVNSTRKGIVPLCADVASLMRAKRRLEKRVMRLKREVDVLRSASHHGSHSSTPTSLQSYMSDRGSFMDPAHVQVFNELLKGTNCGTGSTVSSGSSQVGHSPKSERRPNSALHRTTATVAGQLTLERVVIHQLPDEAGNQLSSPRSAGNQLLSAGSSDTERHSEDGASCVLTARSIPVTSICDTICGQSVKDHCGSQDEQSMGQVVPSVKDQSMGHRSMGQGCCCCHSESMLTLEEQFNKSQQVNLKLVSELASTRKHMEQLTAKLRQLELRELSHQCRPQTFDVTLTRCGEIEDTSNLSCQTDAAANSHECHLNPLTTKKVLQCTSQSGLLHRSKALVKTCSSVQHSSAAVPSVDEDCGLV